MELMKHENTRNQETVRIHGFKKPKVFKEKKLIKTNFELF